MNRASKASMNTQHDVISGVSGCGVMQIVFQSSVHFGVYFDLFSSMNM